MTWDFVHRWYMPFVWIALSSLVSVPAAIYFEAGMVQHAGRELGLAYGGGWVTRDDLWAAMTPYLLGLASVVWLVNRDGSTRWAAFWATGIAVLRIIVPVVLVSSANVTLPNGLHYVDWHSMRVLVWFQDIEMFVLGVLVWIVFGRFVGSSAAAPSGAHAEAY